jgi:isoleucyl-tRNA synthetase
MAARGLIFKGLKPVYWSPSSETALAEAEIEYKDVSATSIYVAFPVVDGKDVLSNDCELVIWTTTPWTMPANLAICAGPDFEYAVVKVGERFFVVATELLETAAKEIGWENYEIIKKFDGSQLEGVTYKHKLFNRVSPVILGDHVTLESGTGLVHTAPGHGEDDFVVGKKYGLDVLCPVDSRGFMTEEAGEFAGLFYETANEQIITRLNEEDMLLFKYIVCSFRIPNIIFLTVFNCF